MIPCLSECVNTSNSLSGRGFYFPGKLLTRDAAWGECCKEKFAYSCSLVRYEYFNVKLDVEPENPGTTLCHFMKFTASWPKHSFG